MANDEARLELLAGAMLSLASGDPSKYVVPVGLHVKSLHLRQYRLQRRAAAAVIPCRRLAGADWRLFLH